MKQQYTSAPAKQLLNRVTEEKMPFEWSINPYRGCAHGCSFCYARGFQHFLGLQANDEFQHHILLKTNAAKVLETQLHNHAARHRFDIDAAARALGVVAIGTATDPYQPVEGKSGITREILTLLAKFRIAVTITTRSPLILRDLDILTQMNRLSVNISINTLDAELTRKLEPQSPLPSGRLMALQELRRHGIHAGVFVAPMLPFLTDSERQLEVLFAACKGHDTSFAMVSMLRLSKEVKAWYRGVLRQQFPSHVALYSQLYAGGQHAEHAYRNEKLALAHALLLKHGIPTSASGSPAPVAACMEAARPECLSAQPSLQPDIEQLTLPF